ncbi:MAG: hypothetical protein RMJ97_11345 [Raineya sp.]|nr:hypothetical protein [Raineya sp.]
MNKTSFTFELPVRLKNKLIELSAKRKQRAEPNASIKAIILECIEKGISEIEQQSNVPSTDIEA